MTCCVFKQDIHFPAYSRPLMMQVHPRVRPSKLFAQFIDNEVFKQMTKKHGVSIEALASNACQVGC